jgi:SAM-dependent methyltransferase
MNSGPTHYLSIDEHGDIFLDPDAPPLSSAEEIAEVHYNLKLSDSHILLTELHDTVYVVEAFDHPLRVTCVELRDKKILLQTRFNTLFKADATKWSVDPWDRFVGVTHTGAPFVLTDKAQTQLFDLCDSFDDEGFVANQEYIPTPPYYIDTPQLETSEYWTNKYLATENPGWNLNGPAEAFKDMLPRLKLPKSRILVLGCGEGHDAAFFAKAGHVVTGVDFSAEAIARGQKKYAQVDGLSFVHSNIFDLPSDWNHSFDIVIEHTCFCAIPPDQRDELVRLYRRMLHEEGQLMGVFFAMEKRHGPPYGSTEWELRKRTEAHFQYLFWGRLRNSIRLGRELFVLAKKR